MDVRITLTLTSGPTVSDTTSEFRTVEECQQVLCRSVGQTTGTISWHSNGELRIFANAHIVMAQVTAVI